MVSFRIPSVVCAVRAAHPDLVPSSSVEWGTREWVSGSSWCERVQDVLDPFSSKAGAGSRPQCPFKCACGAVFMLMRLAGKGMKAEAAICSVVVIQTECGCY